MIRNPTKNRNYVLNIPDIFTFQLMRATYDFEENRLKKINTKFDFEKEIYIDRFLYQNCERFRQFREKLDNMYWNKTKLESNLSAYEYKGISLDEFFTYTKKILFDQMNKDEAEISSEIIPDEGDHFEILPPDDLGTCGLPEDNIYTTIDCLNEYETKIKQNIEKQNLYIHKLRNQIERAYKSSTEYPYVLHAIIIHSGEAISGHYYR